MSAGAIAGARATIVTRMMGQSYIDSVVEVPEDIRCVANGYAHRKTALAI